MNFSLLFQFLLDLANNFCNYDCCVIIMNWIIHSMHDISFGRVINLLFILRNDNFGLNFRTLF